MRVGQCIAFLAAGMHMLSIPTAAQISPLRVEDAIATHSFSELTQVTFSPNGRLLVYAAKDNLKRGIFSPLAYARTGVPLNGMGADIFAVQVTTGETTNLTRGNGNNWAPSWSPDGHYLAFLSDRDSSGQAKLWIWDAAAEKLRKASDVMVRANQVQWLPNNEEVLLTALPANLTPEQFAQRVYGHAAEASLASEDPVSHSAVVVYRSASGEARSANKGQAGPWNLDLWLRDLVKVNVSSGEVKRIDSGRRIAAYAISPDAFHVAVTRPKSFEQSDSQQMLFDLDVFSLDGAGFQILASDVRLRYDGSTFSWSPDGMSVAYQTGGPSRGEARGDCYVVGLQGNVPRNTTNFKSSHDHRGSSPLWDETGRHMYFLHEDAVWRSSPNEDEARQIAQVPNHRLLEILATQGSVLLLNANRRLVVLTYDDESKRSGFYALDVDTGEVQKLLEENHWYAASSQDHLVSASQDGKLVAFFAEDAQHSQELWLAHPDFRDPRRLTHINPQLDNYQFGESRLIAWRSLDGEQLHGTLLLPSGYTNVKRYPLIVCVYGGEFLSSSLVRFGSSCGAMNMQLFATRGYAVLLPDAPQRLGTPMLDLAKTVLPGVDKVIDMGIADASRLGVMGHSYGGYSVLSLLVQTTRFKAAMSADTFSDITASYGQMNKDGSAFGQSGAETGQILMGGPPWQFPERYIENSPLYHLDRIETPLLIVHGTADTTVLPFLSDETFVGLRRLGREAAYAKYQDEGHSPLYWSYANQLDFCNRVIAWFNLHLGGEAPSLAKEHSARN